MRSEENTLIEEIKEIQKTLEQNELRQNELKRDLEYAISNLRKLWTPPGENRC